MVEGRLKLAIGHGLSVWVIEANQGFADARMHSHHAIQITVRLTGELAMIGETSAIQAPAIAISSHAPHRVEAHGLWALIFIEPESSIGQALNKSLFASGPIVALDEGSEQLPTTTLLNAFDSKTGVDDLIATGRKIVGALLPAEAEPVIDPRIGSILAWVSTNLDTSLDQAAEAAGVHLSQSRLRHLFVEQTGLAFKTYLLWLRMQRALAVYADGRSLTQAAHSAGFSDSAHFSRTFRRTFGLPASTLERC